MSGWIQPRLTISTQRYALAIFITALFLFLRGVLDPVIETYISYLAVVPAVVLAAWFCGLGPSLLGMIIAFLGKECLTNVHRHSGSSSAAVRITKVASQIAC